MEQIGTSFTSAVAKALTNSEWRLIHAPSATEDDIIASSPEGKVFVIEVKTGEGSAHFSSLAQVERSAERVSQLQGGHQVTPVLITTQMVSPSLKDMADKVGVRVVSTEGSKMGIQSSADAIARTLSDPQATP